MTFKLRFAAALFVAVSPLVAQDVPSRVHLDVDLPVVTVGRTLSLTLVASFDADAVVSATLLGGHDLRTYLDGEDSVRLTEEVAGTVQVARGTQIRRTISVDTAASWPDGGLIGKSSLVIEWNGLEGARATVRIAPDQSDLDIDTLDLARTKVRLVTNYGEMVVGFFPDKAPNHVRNFVKLSKEGFYDGTRFHRVIRGFMIQGGDPYTKKGSDGQVGTGSPGYRIDAEFSEIKHTRGILSMARSQDPNSAGSQFFVMHGDAPSLDGKYSVFGRLDAGLETLDEITDVPVRPTSRGEPSIPVEDVWLYAAIVEPVLK